MAHTPVKTTTPSTREAFSEMVAKMDRAFERIRDRAFALFQDRGGEPGKELEDWFRAERELFGRPVSEMKDTGAEIELRIDAAGFAPGDLEVKVTPEMIIVEGHAETSREERKEKVYFSEFGQRQLMRQFTLPAPVDPDRVKAHLADGILQVTAPKREVSPARQPAELTAAAGR